jgi:MFS family permease
MGVPAGLALGTGAFALVGAVSGEAAWAWRVSFLLSAILIAVRLFIRLSIYESPAFYAELFGTRVRYSGASFSYQISGIFGGALAPIIAATLFPTGGATLISVYIAVLCTLSALCYFLADEIYRKDIYEEEPAERRLVAEQQG